MVSASQIIEKAANAIYSVVKTNGNADGYIFCIHPAQKCILQRDSSWYHAHPDGDDTMMGYPVKVDPDCPVDTFYLMQPIRLESDGGEFEAIRSTKQEGRE